MSKFAPVNWKTLEQIFLAAGFQFARQEGSHVPISSKVSRVQSSFRLTVKFRCSSFATISRQPGFPATIIFDYWNDAGKFSYHVEVH
jgi:predicted RNA binding protein YcfA (HicA-like mRNA interferase family)